MIDERKAQQSPIFFTTASIFVHPQNLPQDYLLVKKKKIHKLFNIVVYICLTSVSLCLPKKCLQGRELSQKAILSSLLQVSGVPAHRFICGQGWKWHPESVESAQSIYLSSEGRERLNRELFAVLSPLMPSSPFPRMSPNIIYILELPWVNVLDYFSLL